MIKVDLLILNLKTVAAKIERSKLSGKIKLIHKRAKSKTMQHYIAFGLLQKWDDLFVEEFLCEL